MKKRNYLLSLAVTAILTLSSLAGCGITQEAAEIPAVVEETAVPVIVEEVAEVTAAEGGILCIKVNPEIAVHYDDKGLVTKLEARNNDAKAILEKYAGYEGKETHVVVKELVAAIGDAGYFVEEVEGIGKRITIEIEVGSVLPNDAFVDKVVAEVKDYVSSNNYRNSIELEGNTDYGITDYNDTDYGPNNDGVTDYGKTDYNDHVTDYGKTNYDDHVTDYGRTNYDNDSGYDD